MSDPTIYSGLNDDTYEVQVHECVFLIGQGDMMQAEAKVVHGEKRLLKLPRVSGIPADG